MAKDRFSLVKIGETVDKLKQENTELLKQNEALVGMLKRMLSTYDKGTQTYLEANELLNTLNK